MKVYVINRHGRPLMPTTPRKARLLLNRGKAKITGREPFTIQLVYGSSGYTQPVELGIDAGYENIGFSAVNKKEEVIGGELKMLKGMSERITEKRKYRRTRRNRLRYRKPRFSNRRVDKGCLAPSIQHKLDTHHRLIDKIRRILPIIAVTIEVAAYDIQKINNPTIEGEQYQYGEKYGFDNLREYILHRDRHKCQNPNCKNKADDPILQVHHLGFWKNPPDRTDRPANLVTLCTKCHTSKNHQKKGFLFGWEPKLKSFKGETFMTMVRWRLTEEGQHKSTFGYITKGKRRELEIEKSHHNDAFVIAGGRTQSRVTKPLMLEQIRRNKRSMEQFYDAKYRDLRDGKTRSGSELSSGRRTRNINLNGENVRQHRAHKASAGRRSIKKKRYPYKQHDLVLFEGTIYEVIGMQNLGAGVKLKNYPGVKNKVVKPSVVKSIRKRGGLCEVV
ncbi:RNA-guided endonuclease IscB [Coleofasciculus chthonoplastes]|uniref:RNA-guided endonuclease IscB n=1 Tax=Coleofasciculus chthonoplastes TaxID=64178 RepID=UPI000311F883|nr:RNA-guided endonuclease IscB [Coleofasciculus chthonoplastes]